MNNKESRSGPRLLEAYERNDFSKPRDLHFPIRKRWLNLFTWQIWLFLSACLLQSFSPPCDWRVLFSPQPWTSPQAPLSMGFSRQEYCSGLSFPSPGDLPDPGIEAPSPESPYCRWIIYPLSHLKVWKSLSCVWLFATPGTIQSTEFSRPEYWSR